MRFIVDNPKTPRRKLIKLLAEMQARYEPTKSWYLLFANLVDFARFKKVPVYEDRNLNALGRICLYPAKIELKGGSPECITKVLSHEVGHYLAFAAGIPKESKEQWEAVADGIGEVIIEILTSTKEA
jgi:hypothetical protein